MLSASQKNARFGFWAVVVGACGAAFVVLWTSAVVRPARITKAEVVFPATKVRPERSYELSPQEIESVRLVLSQASRIWIPMSGNFACTIHLQYEDGVSEEVRLFRNPEGLMIYRGCQYSGETAHILQLGN
jgi:hypothetical protein